MRTLLWFPLKNVVVYSNWITSWGLARRRASLMFVLSVKKIYIYNPGSYLRKNLELMRIVASNLCRCNV
jgi:hypothetical protein